MSIRHITREGLAWLETEETRLKALLEQKELELREAIDPASWKQTSAVTDLRDQIVLINQQLNQVGQTLAAPIIVEPGQVVDGIKIGARVTLSDTEGTDSFTVSTHWDAAMIQARGGRAISDPNAPIVKALSEHRNNSFSFRGGKVVVN
jgi:transcription elongation GreA/GreB family factor